MEKTRKFLDFLDYTFFSSHIIEFCRTPPPSTIINLNTINSLMMASAATIHLDNKEEFIQKITKNFDLLKNEKISDKQGLKNSTDSITRQISILDVVSPEK